MKFLSSLLLTAALFWTSVAPAQPKEVEYLTLELTDSISDGSAIKRMEKLGGFNHPEYFFNKKNDGYISYSFLKKGKSKWYVYHIDIEGPKTQVISIRQFTDDIVGIEKVSNYGGTITGAVSYMSFINVRTCTFFDLPCYYCEHSYDEKGETASFVECSATFEIKDNILKVTPDGATTLSETFCIEGAEYRMEPTRLVQTKYQGRGGNYLYPVRCLGDVCTGMDANRLDYLLPGTWQRDEPLYQYGFDSEEIGKEVYRESELLFFVTIPYEQVRGIVVVSSQYNVSGYSTSMTVQQVLDKHPEAKLRRDLIADWEYFYLKEEGVRLIFVTDETNRIGKYDADPESESNAIIRAEAIIDYIELH